MSDPCSSTHAAESLKPTEVDLRYPQVNFAPVSKYSTRINKEVIELKGKSVEKLIASGREKLSSMSSGGAVSAVAAERKEEESR
ncbi:conserved hypothetical protein [Culex quinquefasciatus]|uniref:Uncharacterized protein n=1 Tax=Culex quinquefasciatus TaxID=7176 RepID=B0WL87_CULQU|nr:conserved hypothetical protein [Culex quinquefasciatus]|eukprot:XP_001849471.1 conserved hypothetical protein [Culex quinquefasciatus]